MCTRDPDSARGVMLTSHKSSERDSRSVLDHHHVVVTVDLLVC